MEKILVGIYVPVLGCSYDMFVQPESPMHEMLVLVKKAVTEASDGMLTTDESTVLCHREDGTILNINLSVYELGIRNGSKLMLI